MAGRPKTREKWEREAKEAGMTYEEYHDMKIEERMNDERRKEEAKKKRAEMKSLRDEVKMKRSELSGWMVNFVSSNMRKHGQAIFDSLLADDPKGAAAFLTQMMRFAAPAATEPDKAKTGEGGNEQASEHKEALERVNKMKKQFEKQQ